MNRLALLLLALVSFGFGSPLMAGRGSAEQAQAMLGADTWSRVLRIKNDSPDARYGRDVFATVFEFNGMLWFYTDADGTQSLSRFEGRLEADKADLGPLLRGIHAGFYAFKELPERRGEEPGQGYRKLRNGCFIESVHTLRQLREAGQLVLEARLFMVYRKAGRDIVGHTSLVYSTPRGTFVWDPERPAVHEPVSERAQRTAVELAGVVGQTRAPLHAARFLAMDEVGGARIDPRLVAAGEARLVTGSM